MTTTKQELSAKKQLLQSLMKCPHRDLSQTIPVYSKALEDDPLFSGKCFYALTLPEYNKIRDLGEAGVSFLLVSEFPEHRKAGRILFQGLEPYRAGRVGRFLRNDLKKGNRQIKGAVEKYLRTLERNAKRFDGATLHARKELHQLYEFYHIKPNKRAQTVLFEGKTPEGEVDVVQLLKDMKTPEEQAQVIVEYKVPFRVATSAIKSMTPSVWVALISVMTPTEALNARASIEKSGVLEDERIRALYEEKLGKVAKTDKVSVSHISERKSAKGKDERIEKIVQTVRQEKVDKSVRITMDTGIYVDVSGSMQEAIEVAKRLGPMIAAICDGGLRVFCFNDTAYELKVKGKTLADFESAFRLTRANGATCLGAALLEGIGMGFTPEQAIYITDQGENRSPTLLDVYKKQARDTRFVFLTLPGDNLTDKVAKELEEAGADVVNYEFSAKVSRSAWYAELENVIPLLTKGGYIELVQKIMALELPS